MDGFELRDKALSLIAEYGKLGLNNFIYKYSNGDDEKMAFDIFKKYMPFDFVSIHFLGLKDAIFTIHRSEARGGNMHVSIDYSYMRNERKLSYDEVLSLTTALEEVIAKRKEHIKTAKSYPSANDLYTAILDYMQQRMSKTYTMKLINGKHGYDNDRDCYDAIIVYDTKQGECNGYIGSLELKSNEFKDYKLELSIPLGGQQELTFNPLDYSKTLDYCISQLH